jgi:hypothetical protein
MATPSKAAAEPAAAAAAAAAAAMSDLDPAGLFPRLVDRLVHDTTDSLTTFAIMRCCCALKTECCSNEAHAMRHKRSGWLLKGLTRVRQGRTLLQLFCDAKHRLILPESAHMRM